ncbi:MAG: SUMF1/EgtB/PvdO family nonheme iron enzyme [Polyangiales bacterium]
MTSPRRRRVAARARSLAALLALAGCGAPAEDDTDASDAALLDTADDARDSASDTPGDDARDSASDARDASPDVASDASPDARDAASDVRDAAIDARDAATDALDAARDVAIDARDASLDAPRDVAIDARDASLDAAIDGGCPSEMVLIEGRVCVDRWEASLEEVDLDGGVTPWSPYYNPGTRRVRAVSRGGAVPQGYISGAQAQSACRNAGKRLCALGEWVAACRGPTNRTYPYGNTYVRRRCNEGRTPHPVIEFFGTSVGVFTAANMNNPGINMLPNSLAPTGMFWDCVTESGLYDMVGNLHEWIDDPAGTFKGGFYVDAEINGHGCLYTTTAHDFAYRDYSTGFRCCADPR